MTARSVQYDSIDYLELLGLFRARGDLSYIWSPFIPVISSAASSISR